jgi:hypothetical protein
LLAGGGQAPPGSCGSWGQRWSARARRGAASVPSNCCTP